jgi:hypothetical protein
MKGEKRLKAILVRPNFDDATKYTFSFAEDILDACRQANIEVVELAEGEAVKSRVEEELRKGADLFIFYDHGNEDCLVGQDEQPVIDLENCHWLAEKEVFTLACLSAKELGAEVWRQKGKYWGYTEVVGFTTDALEEFKEAFNSGFIFLFLEGMSYQEALEKARETFNRLASALVQEGKIIAAIYMRKNGENLVAYNGQEPDDDSSGNSGCLLGFLKAGWYMLKRGFGRG